MWDLILDALFDSLKVFGVAFVLYIIISFLENFLVRVLEKRSKLSPLVGSALGLIPQCGISVVASDLYTKTHLSLGTLIAIFIACSDEALPILLSHTIDDKKTISSLILIILVKFIFGFLIGFLIDLLDPRNKVKVSKHIKVCDHHVEEDIHVGCCNHSIEDDEEEPPVHKHLLHPLLHSLKIFGYCLAINIIMNLIIHFIGGEEKLAEVLATSKYFGPVLASLIGMIPNCAASVVITEVYLINNSITLGACIAGLVMNAGLGLLFIFKSKLPIKEKLSIIGIMFASSLILGYGVDLVISLLK